tara:strand:+ start:2367 stop:2807 length:441 start_codon:yes stop_codon:yes gene_type:complete
MNQENMNQEKMSWQKWLKENWPNVKALDHDWTMERYDYPQYVRDGITENWIKLNDENGGTWYDPNYHKERSVGAHGASGAGADVAGAQGGAGAQGASGLSVGMDDTNKKALDVMQNEGMEAAVKHMFTDQVSGRKLSYGEMRMRYG